MSGPESPQKQDSESSSTVLRELRSSRKVSWWLDECIRVPGTNMRFGLDPLLGLLPYGGEAVATMIGATIVGQAGRKGLPLKSLVRMSGNMILNAGIGTIPVAGDLFSVWFKSNTRNYRMLNRYLESDHGDEERGGWWPVLLVTGVVLLVLLLNILSWILLTALILWVANQIGILHG